MALQGTAIKIETITLSGGQTTIQFTNIPQTYDDLQIFISARSTRATVEDGLGLQVNGLTSGYTYRNITGNGSSVASANTNFEQTWSGRVPAANATASTFSNNLVYIPNYKNNSVKIYMSDSAAENNATEAYLVMQAISNSTTSAITSITLNALNGNLANGSSATLYGISRTGSQIKATGGTVYDTDTHVYHLFNASGVFTPLQTLSCDLLVVAGGGGGGAGATSSSRGAGGGGAGGYLSYTGVSLSSAQTITIGGGGAGGGSQFTNGSNGNNTVFGSLYTAIGGGFGSRQDTNAGNGGSGGGAGNGDIFGVLPAGGAGTAGQGFAGGSQTSSAGLGGCGGGGATAIGGVANSSSGAAGGAGATSSITGTSVVYATGGAGGNTTGATNGATATINTGNGGGGGNGFTPSLGGAGGSGVVIVRYAK
jgi:hypothetical protein